MTEEVSFRDTADILLLFIQNGDGGVAMSGEPFQPLADCISFVEKHGEYFGDHDFRYVHFISPYCFYKWRNSRTAKRGAGDLGIITDIPDYGNAPGLDAV